MPPALEFDCISKQFGTAYALRDASFTIAPGEILGLVGPNGAGKTTAMQIATGFLHASSGRGSLMGLPFYDAASRRLLGFVPDAPVFFAGNAIGAVRFAAQLSDFNASREAIETVLRTVGITEWKRDVRRFSRGMQQRLALAQALIHRPRVLILDEPASALDPEGVVEVRALLESLRCEGASILLSSHQLNEVALVSDRIAFLHQGRLLRCGSLDDLLGNTDQVQVTMRGLAADTAFTAAWGGIPDDGRWTVPAQRTRQFLEAAWARGAELVSVTPVRADLTELYMKLLRSAERQGNVEEEQLS